MSFSRKIVALSTKLLHGGCSSTPIPQRLSQQQHHAAKISVLSRTKRCFTTQQQQIHSKVVESLDKAIELSPLKAGDTMCVGGFGICGTPVGLLQSISKLSNSINNLTIVSNNAGIDNWGIGILLQSRQVKRMVSSYVGENKEFARQYLSGELEVEFVPQGTLAERLRAGGAGIPGFYTKTGYGTWIQQGNVPIKYNSKGEVEIYSDAKPVHEFDNEMYVLERGIVGNIALIKAHQVDEFGNCKFRGTARNFNPECAASGKYTIVEAEEIVPLGYFKPEDIHLPGAYINSIVQHNAEKKIEILKHSKNKKTEEEEQQSIDTSNIKDERLAKRYRIIKRAAMELNDNMVVNLGIGMPTLVPNFVDKSMKIWLQSENGLLGMGKYPYFNEEDADLINAGKETVTCVKGASIFSSSESFQMIRGGHVNLSILGAMEVSQYGDIANWMVPGAFVKGMGGAMDLVSSGSKVIVTMEHNDKNGNAKIVEHCQLPLTGPLCCTRIITDLAVFDVDHHKGLTLIETLDNAKTEDIMMKTGCKFEISPNLKQVSVLK